MSHSSGFNNFSGFNDYGRKPANHRFRGTAHRGRATGDSEESFRAVANRHATNPEKSEDTSVEASVSGEIRPTPHPHAVGPII